MIKQDRTEPGPEPINPNSKVLAPFMWGSANKLAFWMLQRLKPSAAWWRDRAQRRRAGGAKSSKASWGRGRASRRQKEAKPRSRCATGLGLTHGARASRGPKLWTERVWNLGVRSGGKGRKWGEINAEVLRGYKEKRWKGTGVGVARELDESEDVRPTSAPQATPDGRHSPRVRGSSLKPCGPPAGREKVPGARASRNFSKSPGSPRIRQPETTPSPGIWAQPAPGTCPSCSEPRECAGASGTRGSAPCAPRSGGSGMRGRWGPLPSSPRQARDPSLRANHVQLLPCLPRGLLGKKEPARERNQRV
jgi:hypothetical protein